MKLAIPFFLLILMAADVCAYGAYFPKEYAPRLLQLPRPVPQERRIIPAGDPQGQSSLAAWRELARGGDVRITQKRGGYLLPGDTLLTRDGSFVMGELGLQRRLRLSGAAKLLMVELDGALSGRLERGELLIETKHEFVLLAAGAKIIGKSSIFEVTLDAEGQAGELRVREGMVYFWREQGSASEIRAGRKLGWRLDSKALRFGLLK